MLDKNISVGIIGAGFVGKIMKDYYKEAKQYDIVGEHDPLEEVLTQDVIFLAFNLKDNCRSEESYNAIADYARQAPDNRIFIVKSTFIPHTTDRLQAEFPQHIFVYNPEFLTEATAWHDFTKPWCQILGCPQQSLKIVHDILFPILPDAPVKRVMSPLDAEVLKHATNSYYSTKVIFFNELYDACEKIGADYETVRDILVQDNRIGDSHSVIKHNGYRGFGGKCLVKDTEAFEEVSESPLLAKVIEINEKLRNL